MRIPRFSIRDLLWLMTVAGVLLALAVSLRTSSRLRRELKELESKYRTDTHSAMIQRQLYERAIEDITGRKVTGFSFWGDNNGGYKYEVEYDFEGRPPPKKSN